MEKEICKNCRGKGQVDNEPCPECEGTGLVEIIIINE